MVWKRYRVRCRVADCKTAPIVAGPDTEAHSALMWIVFRAHCDDHHRGVRHPRAKIENVTDETDWRELIL